MQLKGSLALVLATAHNLASNLTCSVLALVQHFRVVHVCSLHFLNTVHVYSLTTSCLHCSAVPTLSLATNRQAGPQGWWRLRRPAGPPGCLRPRHPPLSTLGNLPACQPMTTQHHMHGCAVRRCMTTRLLSDLRSVPRPVHCLELARRGVRIVLLLLFVACSFSLLPAV